MNKYTKTVFTDTELLNLFNYYKTHSHTNTAWHFHIGVHHLKNILEEHKIKVHSKEENKKFRLILLKQNNLEKYGVTNTAKLDSVKEKAKQTCLERYGVENTAAVEAFKEKGKQTCLRKYGYEHASQSEDFQKRREQTCLEKYGVSNVFQDDNIKKKMRQTCLEKYGSEYIAQVENIKQKAQQTCLEKYGTVHYAQSEEFKGTKKYKLFKEGNIYFDSFPELCFYLYYKDLGYNINRNEKRLTYYFNNKKHYTFIDFEINGKLYEIKGDYLYQRMLVENTVDNAKLKCLLENNVEIILKKDYQKYEDYFYEHYNKEDYINK